MTLWQVWLTGLVSVAGLMTLTWAVSLIRQDASLVDRVWGLGFVVAAWTYASASPDASPRAWLALALVSIWGIRLSAHISWRNWGHGEDQRYAAMRERRPSTFPLRSLPTVFLLQAALASVISVPLLAAIAGDGPAHLTWFDLLAGVLWGAGMVFEAGGDLQLARFRSDPANRGRVLETGLWRYTRHPNYFGDTLVWWSFFLLALPNGAWWTAVGPVVMTFFIVRVSGVAMTDQLMASGGSQRAGYVEYVRRTNAFIPGPRKS